MTGPRIDPDRAAVWHLNRPRRCVGATVYTFLSWRFKPRRCTRWATHAVLIECAAGHTAWAVTCGLCLADTGTPTECRTCGAPASRTVTVELGSST